MRIVLAAVFLVAGASKLRNPGALMGTLAVLGLPWRSLRKAVVLVVGLGEFALGLWLAVGVALPVAALAAGGVLTIFTAVLWLTAIRHGSSNFSCGCFGESASDTSIWPGLLRNGLLIAAAGVLAGAPSDRTDSDGVIAASLIAAGSVALFRLAHVAAAERRHLFAPVRQKGV